MEKKRCGSIVLIKYVLTVLVNAFYWNKLSIDHKNPSF